MSKALVIDDSRAIRLILGKTLAEIGFEVRQAANGKEALGVLEQESDGMSVVLVDWNMPEMNGIEFVTAMRANPAWAGITLMMVTTETEMEQMSRALEAGANEYVMKPFNRDIIEDKLRLLGVLH